MASKRFGLAAACIAAGILVLAASNASAAVYTWTQTTGGTYSWTTGADWDGGVAPDPVSGDTVDLSTVNLAGSITLNLDADRPATTWNFGDTSGSENWTVNAGTPVGKLILAGTTPTINVVRNTTTIGAVVDGTDGLTKIGGGTLTLTGANAYTGDTIVSGGTLKVTGKINGTTGTALTFGGTGTFNANEAANVSQGMGTLTFIAGDGAVQSTYGGSGSNALTFSSLAARTAGATGNFIVTNGTNGSTNKIVLTGVTTGAFIDKGVFFGGSNYAWYDGTEYVRAMAYGSDAGTATSGADTSVASATHQQITGVISAQADGTAFTTFKISGASNLTLASGATVTMGSILKTGNNAATISGGTGIQASTNAELVIRSDQSSDGLTISTPILANGTNALTKSGPGSLTLTGANAFTGPLTIIAGTLYLGNNTTTGSLSSSTNIVNHGTLNFNRSNTITQGTDFGSVISGTGGVTQSRGTVILNGVNTYTGMTRISGGTMNIASIPNAGAAGPIGAYPTTSANGLVLQGTLNYTGGTATSNRGLSISGDWGTGYVNVSAAGTSLTLGELTKYDAKDNTLRVTGGSGSSLNFTSVTLAANMFLNTDIDMTIASVGGGAAFTKRGTGTLFLNSANTYLGGTTVDAGFLNISNDNNLGPVTGALTFNGGKLQFAASSNVTLNASRPVVMSGTTTSSVDTSLASGAIASTITGTGNLTKIGDNTLTLSGANTFTGDTTVSGGILKLGTATALQNSAYVTTGSNGSTIGLDVNGNATPTLGGLSGAVDLASAIVGYSGATGLTLNPQSGKTPSYSGVIADGAPGMTLTKTGYGTQTLSGANAYTGATSVTGGLLIVNGDQSLATGAVGVSSGAIGGTGTIGGAVTLSGTGGVDLRNGAAGTLNLASTLAVTGDAGANTLSFDLAANAAATDTIAVAGAVSLTNPAVIRLNQISGPGSRLTAGTYDLLTTATGTLPDISNFILPMTKAFGQTFNLALDSETSQKLQLTSTQAAAGPAAAFWAGGTDAVWTSAANWNTDATSEIAASGAPSYQTNVNFHTTTPAAGNLSNTLGADFDINSLTFAAAAASPVTIGGTNRTLTIEATNANGNTSGNGITVNTPSTGTVEHTISADVGLAASQTWTVNPSATLTVSGDVTDLSGGYTLGKGGTGTLNLNGATSVGSLTVGYQANGGNLVVGSGGTLSAGSGSSSNLYVGHGTSAGFSGTLDASLSSSFTANVGNLYVGMSYGSNGTLKLGTSNTITASSLFSVGAGLWGSESYGTLTTADSGNTTINTPTVWVGYGTANGTTPGTGTFTLGSDATLNLDGIVAGNPSGRTALLLGCGVGQYSARASGIMDLSAGVADLKLRSLVVASRTGNGPSTGVLTLGTSASNHLDISGVGSVVKIGYLELWGGSQNGGTANGTVTIGNLDATSSITSTDNSTAILLGYRGPGATGSCNGTLNLNGGTLTITTTGSAIAGGGGNSYLNMDGITLKAGASSTTWIQGLTAAKIKSGGVTFNTMGNNITIAQSLITDAVSTGGGLTKAGLGTLTLTGSNTYTGDTKVEEGTLSITNDFLADAADVYLTTGATLNLGFAVADTIDELFIGGNVQHVGTWGAPGSGATYVSSLLSGTGWLNVMTGLTTLPGDTNSDGVVDAADYLAVKQNLGLTGGASLAQGNLDDDGDVDWADLQILMTNFGAGASTTPATAPEPATLGLLALGALAVLRRRRHG